MTIALPPARPGATRRVLLGCLIAGFLAGLGHAQTQTLRVGMASEPSSIDPHFSRTGNNQMVAEHMFDRLATFDENLRLGPGLAVSWRTLDPLTWEISLRAGVTFSDGRPFGAEDVIFSFERARDMQGSPAPFSGAVAALEAMQARDAATLILRTRQPTPQLMQQIGIVFIASKAAAQGKSTDDFRRGVGAIGTGAYRLVEWKPGERIRLAANPSHWGGKPAFPSADIRFIANPGARVAALLAGEVDIIDQAPTNDLEAIQARGFNVVSADTARIVYLAFDSAREQSPFITGKDGRPLARNPLMDARVRLALSKLIDRDAIVARLLRGAGSPASQMVPPGMAGHEPSLKPEKFDVAGARRLLAEAGYPDGFGITLHTSSDRFPGDKELGQAIGQYFARGGLSVNAVDAKTYAVYAAEATRRAYSAFVFSFGSTTPDAAGALMNVLASHDPAKGRGAFNRARYSNTAFDTALERALAEFDEPARDAQLRAAQKIAFLDVALAPLYFQKLHWAMRKGLAYAPGMDEAMHAHRVGDAK